MNIRQFFVLSLFFWAGSISGGQGVPTPMELPGGNIVSLQQAKGLVAKAGRVIDVRSAINYGRGHIPGAIFAPYKGKSAKQANFDSSLDRFTLSVLPEEKDASVLFYSHGDTGWKSYKAAVIAIRSGYTRVSWFRDGFSAWAEAGLPIAR